MAQSDGTDAGADLNDRYPSGPDLEPRDTPVYSEHFANRFRRGPTGKSSQATMPLTRSAHSNRARASRHSRKSQHSVA